jgi:hypothetical protein
MLDIQQEFQDMLKGSAELTEQYESNKALIDNVLHALSVYKCEQAVAKMSITFNMITDSKTSKRVYVQARGAVPFKKGQRKWVGVCLGKKADIVDSKNEIRAYWKVKGETMVRQKVLAALKTELNLH